MGILLMKIIKEQQNQEVILDFVALLVTNQKVIHKAKLAFREHSF